MSEILKNNIEELSLNYNGIDNEWIIYIFEILKKWVKKLYLNGNYITNAGADRLLEALPETDSHFVDPQCYAG